MGESGPLMMMSWAGLTQFRLWQNGHHMADNIFTRGQFWPSGIVVACVCVSVSLCVNHLLVHAITRDPFKLGLPNLKHRCKRPWLRSLLFWGVIDLYIQGQIYLQSQNLPHFELVRAIAHHIVQARTTKFGPELQNTLVKIPIVLGVDWAWHVKLNLFSKSCLFASLLRLWNIC